MTRPSKKSEPPQLNIDRRTFIEGLLPPSYNGDICLTTAVDTGDSVAFPGWRYNRKALGKINAATHLVTSSVGTANTGAGNASHADANLVEGLMIQIDDAGSKGNKVPILPPTAAVMTSVDDDGVGVFTFFYKMTRAMPLDEMADILASLLAAGIGDKNCMDLNRCNRLPGSKPVTKDFTAELATWEPERAYDPDTFVKELQIAEVKAEAIRASGGGYTQTPAPQGVEVHDTVLDWLAPPGSPDHEGFHEIPCPWVHLHSDRRGGAKYRPASEEDVVRAFKCHHSHPHGTQDFLRWVETQGGPAGTKTNILNERDRNVGRLAEVMGPRPENLPEPETFVDQDQDDIQAGIEGRYVLYTPKNQVYDILGPDTFPLHVLGGLKAKWAPHRIVVEDGKPICRIAMWINNHKMETAILPHLDPRVEPGWTGTFINTWRPFQPVKGEDGKPNTFLDIVAHVYPEDTDYALDWMAHKLQNPWARQVALVSYTPVGGTGRNTVMHIMRQLLGNSTLETASKLFGDKSDKFNSVLDNLLVCVGEVDEAHKGEHRGVSKAIFNRLKELVDPDETDARLERKGVEGQNTKIFTSFMIATNAGNGLPLERGERRFSVCKGNLDRLPTRFNKWIAAARGGDVTELSKIHHYLMTRDVAAFEPAVARDTGAKDDMIEEGKNDVDKAIESFMHDNKLTVVATAPMAEYIHRTDDTINGMMLQDVKRQAGGWMRAHTLKVQWIGDPKGRLKARGTNYPVRCTFEVAKAGEGVHRTEYNRFLDKIGVVEKSPDGKLVYLPTPDEE